MHTAFEYGNRIEVPDREALELYLCSLWKEYKETWSNQWDNGNANQDSKCQHFLTFDGKFAKPSKYIGFIQFEDFKIEIFPKVFRNAPEISNEIMHRHLFYWFSYCNKMKFPFIQAFLDRFEIDDLPELIMYLFANQIHEVVSSQPYSSYEEVQEALFTPRGRINFNRYVSSMSYSNYHRIDCDYEPFVFDNSLNRIIKYCTRLLLSKTRVSETQRIMNEIIFVLDEVDDQVCYTQQLETLKISPIYSDYEDVIQICRMILENQVYSHEDYDMKNWSLLFPMEVIFEQFIAGFIKAHFGNRFKVESQKSDLYLQTDPKAFLMKHDILLTNRYTKEQIIIDTKYMPRWDLKETDPKQGIEQSDMYQMISYAYRRGMDKVILIYPNTSEELPEDTVFRIKNGSKDEIINIKAIDVPFWSEDGTSHVEENLKIKLSSVLQNEF